VLEVGVHMCSYDAERGVDVIEGSDVLAVASW
jgi:hypothetical protein